MTYTPEQNESLRRVAARTMVDDIRSDPEYWSRRIVSEWKPEFLVDYLDLDSIRPEVAQEIVADLGFDPREIQPKKTRKAKHE